MLPSPQAANESAILDIEDEDDESDKAVDAKASRNYYDFITAVRRKAPQDKSGVPVARDTLDPCLA